MKFIYTINSTLKDNLRFRIILITLCTILILLRQPALLLYPRLWAEEGFVFYEFALHHTLYDIFFTAHVGYLTLFNSLVSAVQAKIFQAENAAIISTYLGFSVQLIPVYIIIFTSQNFWDSAFKKMIYAFMVIVVMAPELTLNTTNSHFIFGLITFLVMLISGDKLSKFQKYFFRLLLFIGGLTGPASILFTPMFLLKACREKSKEKYIQAIILSICAVTQASVIIYSLLFNNKYQRLSNHNYKRTIYYFFVDNFSMLPHTSTSYQHQSNFFLGLLFGFCIAVFLIYILIKNIKNIDYLISLVSLLLVGTCSTLGSLNMDGAPRYAYIPTSILAIIIISEAFKKNAIQNTTKNIASLILVICLCTNAIYYRYGMRNVYAPSYPKWKEEVAKYRIDNTYKPRIHPGTDPVQCVRL